MKRGFGSPNYNHERAREVRRLGMQALRARGKAHQWRTYEEASAAGQKGGANSAIARATRRRGVPSEDQTA
jgi:hypothetical protein